MPITAVLKLHLASIDHPLSLYVVGILAGKQASRESATHADDATPASHDAAGLGGDVHRSGTLASHNLKRFSAMEAATQPLVAADEAAASVSTAPSASGHLSIN